MNGPAHCSECHTPRNALGAPERERFLAGTRDGPDGKPVPNITPHEDGIGTWSKSDLVFAFQTAILPDGDAFGGAMAEVVEDGLSHLSKEDLEAIAEYLLTVAPLPDALPALPNPDGTNRPLAVGDRRPKHASQAGLLDDLRQARLQVVEHKRSVARQQPLRHGVRRRHDRAPGRVRRVSV